MSTLLHPRLDNKIHRKLPYRQPPLVNPCLSQPPDFSRFWLGAGESLNLGNREATSHRPSAWNHHHQPQDRQFTRWTGFFLACRSTPQPPTPILPFSIPIESIQPSHKPKTRLLGILDSSNSLEVRHFFLDLTQHPLGYFTLLTPSQSIHSLSNSLCDLVL
jgi:hypothetical protein